MPSLQSPPQAPNALHDRSTAGNVKQREPRTVCTASDVNQTQTPPLQCMSSARVRRAFVHDIVRWMNLRSISRYRVIDMITRKMLYHMEKATITKTSTSTAIFQGRTSQEMPFSTPSSSTTLCLKNIPSFKLSVTLSNLNQFSKCLHCWKAYEICYKTHMTLPTST